MPKKRRRLRSLTTKPAFATLRGVGSLTHYIISSSGGVLSRRVSQPAGSVSVMSLNGLGHGAHADGTTNDLDHINAAMTTAGAGGTVWFPAGKYAMSSMLTVYDYVSLCGAGIWTQSIGGGDGGVWLYPTGGSEVHFGSHSRIERMLIGRNTAGQECSFRPNKRGDSTAGAHTNTYGCHDNVFSFVRFKGGSDGGKQLLYVNNTGSNRDWGGTIQTWDFYGITFDDCEFERPMTASTGDGESVRIWCDVRSGGSQIHHLAWNRCHFGCKNGYGAGTSEYGVGRTLIFQNGPDGDGTGGPCTGGGSEIHYDVDNPSFDWGLVDHNFHDVSFTDCLFEHSLWYPFNPCDESRLYSTWQSCQLYNYTGGLDSTYGWGNDIGTQWVNIPTRIWADNFSFTRCYAKGSSSYNSESEFARNLDVIDSYHYPSDAGWGPHRALYGNSVTGSFSNASRPTTANFDRDWSGSTTTYTGSPNDP